MVCFNWLHLTDLHWGMKGQDDYWPQAEQKFFDDLAYLIKKLKVGPLDLVLFTGDLTQSGDEKQFQELDKLLKRFWDKLSAMGSKPRLLAVPGNHDLVRPDNPTDPTLITLMHLWEKSEVQGPFWDNPMSDQRRLVEKAFTNYSQWWESTSIHKPESYSKGILPGDFAATVEKEGVELGIVGLNSSFLQLNAGPFKERLALHVRQFHQSWDRCKPLHAT